MTDFCEGFIADAKLLVSAEVFADFLTQAEVLLEHDYKDAAAVIIRAVLEDGLRRVCLSKGIEFKDRAGVDDLAQALTKQNVLTAVQKKEIDAKREIGNAAAHGRFGEFTKQDVVAFHEFVRAFARHADMTCFPPPLPGRPVFPLRLPRVPRRPKPRRSTRGYSPSPRRG